MDKQVNRFAVGSSVGHWLMSFLYTLKKIGYKIVPLAFTLSLITAGVLMISLFCSPYQSI